MKTIFKSALSVLFFSTFLIFAVGSEDEVDNKDVASVEDANKLTDKKLEEFDGKYKKLCDSKRNDKLKEEFISLRGSIGSYRSDISEAKNLDYDEQRKARDYFDDNLKKYSNLHQLVNRGEIECW